MRSQPWTIAASTSSIVRALHYAQLTGAVLILVQRAHHRITESSSSRLLEMWASCQSFGRSVTLALPIDW